MKYWEHEDDGKGLEPPTKWEVFIHTHLSNFGWWLLSVIILLVVLYIGGTVFYAPIFNPGQPTPLQP